MSYVKYREDDIKITDDRRYMRRGSEFAADAHKTLIYYDCKYCQAVFDERRQLYRHIKQMHNIVRPLVLINGKVAGKSCLIENLDSALLDLYGYREPITLNGRIIPIEERNENDEIDITEQLLKELLNNPRCRISFSSDSIDIQLISYNIPQNPFVTETLLQWEHAISLGKKLTIPDFDQQEDDVRLYLDGMYNYYVAAYAKNDKVQRYNDALAILSHFHELDGRGKCVLKIIAYRRNWLSKLDTLTAGDNDIFTVASDYYHHQQSDTSVLPANDSARSIYIEDATKRILDLVLLFQQKEYGLVRNQLSRMPEIEDLEDQNLKDQYYLLLAKMSEQEGNYRKAEQYYGKLMAPAFRTEYEGYKNRISQSSRINGDEM